MHWLGRIYGGLEKYPEDEKEAFHWLKLAAEGGDAQSQCNLGVCYMNGNGVMRDEKIGMHWYRAAAKQGDDWASYLLGLCYRDGLGVKRNRRLARHWFNIAILKGVKEAARALRKMSRRNTN